MWIILSVMQSQAMDEECFWAHMTTKNRKRELTALHILLLQAELSLSLFSFFGIWFICLQWRSLSRILKCQRYLKLIYGFYAWKSWRPEQHVCSMEEWQLSNYATLTFDGVATPLQIMDSNNHEVGKMAIIQKSMITKDIVKL